MLKKIFKLSLIWIVIVNLFFSWFCFADNNENNISGPWFMLDVNKLSPANTKYTSWSEFNIKELIWTIAKLIVIIIPTLAVLFMVIWWLMMILSWWKTGSVNKWKTIIQYNLMAIVIALFSYSIIRLIVWLLWSNTT